MTRWLLPLVLLAACSGPPQQSLNPADLAIAVGHYDVVTLGNFHLQVIDKATRAVRRSVALGNVAIIPTNSGLWGPVTDVTPPGNAPLLDCNGDTRIIYDANRSRWYVSAFNVVHPQSQRGLCLAVSKTSDPLGGWWAASLTPAGQTFDFMQLSFTQGHIVVSDTGDRPIRAISALGAGEGVFSNVITWPRPHGGVMVPVRKSNGTGYAYLALWADQPPGRVVLYRNRIGVVGTEQQWGFSVPGLAQGFFSQVPGPSGSSFGGAATPSITEAWYDWHSRTVWFSGNTLCGNGAWICGYVAQIGLWDGQAMLPLDSGTTIGAALPIVWKVRTLLGAEHTLWPGMAVSGIGGVTLSVMAVSPNLWPTHVATFIPSPVATSLSEPVQAELTPGAVETICRDPKLGVGTGQLSGFSCSGNGTGPSGFGVNQRGPDYQECAPDPTDDHAVWCTAQYWGGNQWLHHVSKVYTP